MKLNTDSAIFQFLGTLVDFVGLNLIFLLTCIPILTIGPALSSLFTVTLREAAGEHGYFIISYLKAFRANFKSGVGIFLSYFFTGVILLFNISFWMSTKTVPGSIIAFLLGVLILLYALSAIYVFALNARFENSIRQTLKNALCLPLVNPVLSLLMLAILIVTAAIVYFIPAMRVFFILFGFSFLAYCESFLLHRVFNKQLEEQL